MWSREGLLARNRDLAPKYKSLLFNMLHAQAKQGHAFITGALNTSLSLACYYKVKSILTLKGFDQMTTINKTQRKIKLNTSSFLHKRRMMLPTGGKALDIEAMKDDELLEHIMSQLSDEQKRQVNASPALKRSLVHNVKKNGKNISNTATSMAKSLIDKQNQDYVNRQQALYQSAVLYVIQVVSGVVLNEAIEACEEQEYEIDLKLETEETAEMDAEENAQEANLDAEDNLVHVTRENGDTYRLEIPGPTPNAEEDMAPHGWRQDATPHGDDAIKHEPTLNAEPTPKNNDEQDPENKKKHWRHAALSPQPGSGETKDREEQDAQEILDQGHEPPRSDLPNHLQKMLNPMEIPKCVPDN